MNDPLYFQAVFHTLPQVKGLLQAQDELGSANEQLASTHVLSDFPVCSANTRIENNLVLQEQLYQFRVETKEAFDEAKALESKWASLEKEQREVYQVNI